MMSSGQTCHTTSSHLSGNPYIGFPRCRRTPQLGTSLSRRPGASQARAFSSATMPAVSHASIFRYRRRAFDERRQLDALCGSTCPWLPYVAIGPARAVGHRPGGRRRAAGSGSAGAGATRHSQDVKSWHTHGWRRPSVSSCPQHDCLSGLPLGARASPRRRADQLRSWARGGSASAGGLALRRISSISPIVCLRPADSRDGSCSSWIW